MDYGHVNSIYMESLGYLFKNMDIVVINSKKNLFLHLH